MIKEYLDKISMSRIQTLRSMGGKKWEESMIESGESYGVVDARKVYITSSTDGKVHLDGLINDNIMLELTTSADHSKLATIQKQSRLWKERYPNRKFVVGLKVIKSPRKIDGKDSVYDQLLKTKAIDNILVGEEEILKFFIKPYWDKQEKINKLKTNNKKILSNKGESNMKFDQLVIREAMKVSDMDPVSFLLAYGSSAPAQAGDTTKMSKAQKHAVRSAERRGLLCTNPLTLPDLQGEVTQSIREFAVTLGKKPAYADLGKFVNSAMATRMIDAGEKLVYDPTKKCARDAWHITQSAIDKYWVNPNGQLYTS